MGESLISAETIKETFGDHVQFIRRGLNTGGFPMLNDQMVGWAVWFAHVCEENENAKATRIHANTESA